MEVGGDMVVFSCVARPIMVILERREEFATKGG